MKHKKRLTTLILPLLLILTWSQLGFTINTAGVNQTTTEIGTVSASTDAEILDLMSSGSIPSLQCGIVVQDRLAWAKGYGDQPDLDTVFMIGSITKTFTATAILQLVEQGLIDLDADINTYLPFSVRNPDFPADPVTTRQLLAHTSGLAREIGYFLVDNQLIGWVNDQFGESFALWASPPALDEIITSTSMANASVWDNRPGTTFVYSNLGFMLLSYILEEVTGQTLASYVQEHITDPLGMGSTGFSASDFPDRLAIGYERVNVTTIAALPHYDTYYWGAGQLRSTVLDLAPYMIAHMNLGRYGTTQLLQPSSVELMHQSVTEYYGLGWTIDEQIHGHGGNVFGYWGLMFYRETEQGSYGVIILVNRDYLFHADTAFTSSVEDVFVLLFEEAERMFEQALVNAGLTMMLVIGGISAGVAVTIIVVVILKRRGAQRHI